MQEKIHPFSYERDSISPGSAAIVFEEKGVRFGIIVCYDMVFAPVARTLARKGAQVICSPSRIVSRGVAPVEYVRAGQGAREQDSHSGRQRVWRQVRRRPAWQWTSRWEDVVDTRVTRLEDGQSYAVRQVEPGRHTGGRGRQGMPTRTSFQ